MGNIPKRTFKCNSNFAPLKLKFGSNCDFAKMVNTAKGNFCLAKTYTSGLQTVGSWEINVKKIEVGKNDQRRIIMKRKIKIKVKNFF